MDRPFSIRRLSGKDDYYHAHSIFLEVEGILRKTRWNWKFTRLLEFDFSQDCTSRSVQIKHQNQHNNNLMTIYQRETALYEHWSH